MTALIQKFDRICRRLYARGALKLQSAALFGGGESDTSDITLTRDAHGNPYIPGSSLAGAARTYLARRLHPWHEFQQGDHAWKNLYLFGYPDANGDRTMSPLWIKDAPVENMHKISIRDGVRIEHKSGVAMDKGKFDFECVEAGAAFIVELQCVIRENDLKPDEIVKQFFGLLHALHNGEIRLGGRTRRGLGHGSVQEWRIADLDMSNKNHLLPWLADKQWDVGNIPLPEDSLADQRSFFKINTIFSLNHSILIREQLFGKDDSDYRHLMSNGRPLATGSSLTGAFRARSAMIASTLWQDDSKVCEALSEMFGPLHDAKQKAGTSLWSSRITIDETFIENGAAHYQDRVTIDRFTGGTLDTAKFNEEVWQRDVEDTLVHFNLCLEEPCNWEIGLLLLTLRDFWLGLTGFGGEAALGRGLVKGKSATLSLQQNENETHWEITSSPQEPFSCPENLRQTLEEYVIQLAVPPDLRFHPGSRRPVTILPVQQGE